MNRLTGISKKKVFFGILGVVIVALIAFRLYLPVLVKDYVNKQLNKDPLYKGSIEEVDIHLWRGAYTIKGLKLEKVEGQKKYPFVAARDIHIGISWPEILNRSILAQIHVHDFQFNIVQEPAKKEEGKEKKVQIVAKTKEGQKKEARTWNESFKNLVPLKLGRLHMDGGSIHFRDITADPDVNVYLDRIIIDGKNLTNSEKLSKDLFGRIVMDARVMKSGDLNLELVMNPLIAPPEFELTTKLSNLNLTELNSFFTALGKFDVKKGSFGLYSEMATSKGKVKGYFKPIIKDLQVSDIKKDSKKGFFHVVWQKIVGAVAFLLKNHQEDQQAAKIPFSGDFSKPDFNVADTVTSVLENIFVKPIAPKVDDSINLKDVNK